MSQSEDLKIWWNTYPLWQRVVGVVLFIGFFVYVLSGTWLPKSFPAGRPMSVGECRSTTQNPALEICFLTADLMTPKSVGSAVIEVKLSGVPVVTVRINHHSKWSYLQYLVTYEGTVYLLDPDYEATLTTQNLHATSTAITTTATAAAAATEGATQ